MSGHLRKLLNIKIEKHGYRRNLIVAGIVLLLAVSALVYGFITRHEYVAVSTSNSTLPTVTTKFNGTLSANPIVAIHNAFGYLARSGGTEMTEATDLSIIGINIKSSNNGTLASIQSSGQFDFKKAIGSFSVSTLNSKLQPMSTFNLLNVDSELFLSLNLAKLPKQYQNYQWTQITQTNSYTVSNILYYVLAKPNIFIKALNAATSVIDE